MTVISPTQPRRLGTRPVLSLATLVAVCLTLASSAQAASYDVHSCHLPSGEVAATDNWRSQSSGAYVSAFSDCSTTGGSLFASLANTVNHNDGDQANWTFNAPPDTRITELETTRHVNAGPFQNYGVPQYLLYADQSALEGCNRYSGCQSLDGTTRFDVNAASSIDFQIACSGFAGCPARSEPQVDMAISRTQIRLRDDIAPQVSDVGGELASAQTVSGTPTMTFNASDRGGGVYRTRVYADDALISDEVTDDNNRRCTEPFTYAIPCKLATAGRAALDTTRFEDGRTISVRVEVTDAAGNRAIALSPHPVLIDNVPACLRQATRDNGLFLDGAPCNPLLRKNSNDANGQGATPDARFNAYFSRHVPARCTTRRARRAHKHCVRTAASTVTRVNASAQVTLRGRLTSSTDTPIGGATVWLAKTVEGAAPRMLGPLTTGPDGRFHTRLDNRQPSGSVRLYYFPSSAGSENVASGELRLRVRAGVFLTAKRLDSRRVGFRGHVLTTVANNGLAVALQVREHGQWRTFRQLRAQGPPPRARFSAAYRFIGRPPATRYRFRAVVIRQAGLPYDTGTSNAQLVRMRRR